MGWITENLRFLGNPRQQAVDQEGRSACRTTTGTPCQDVSRPTPGSFGCPQSCCVTTVVTQVACRTPSPGADTAIGSPDRRAASAEIGVTTRSERPGTGACGSEMMAPSDWYSTV